MSVTVTQELTQQTVTVTGNPVENNVTVTVSNARGPSGGGSGSNSVTSATTSDGTADLSLLNVTTATAEVTGTLTANHIHGNLAGSVYAHVRAGEALTKGDPVYVSGFNNGTSTAEVSKADASNAAKMPAIGIMDANLAHNATGHMVITGTITDVNTAGYAVNAELYVAAGGGMTATPPTARAQPVARVERVNLNNGAIIVKVNGLSASDNTPSTLVRRTANGDASFSAVDVSTLTASGISTTGQVEFNGTDAGDSLTFNMVNYTYGAGAASAHRFALNGGAATGAALFTAATPAAALTTLGGGTAATGTGAVVLATSPTFAGQIAVAAGSATAPSIVFDGFTNTGIYRAFSSVAVSVSGSLRYWFGPTRFEIYNDSISLGGSIDLVLNRDAANTLGQRNGTNAQALRVYNTYTSTTSFERLNFRWSTNVAIIGTEKGSAGGTARDLVLETDGTERMRVSATGNVGIGTTSPGVKLDILGDASSSNNAYSRLTRGANTSDAFVITKPTGALSAGNPQYSYGIAANTSYFSFQRYDGTTATSDISISTTGNVGIGTASPTALLDVNSNTLRLRTARTPASATAAGNAGDICWDANYIYVCTATNTWKRTAIATW